MGGVPIGQAPFNGSLVVGVSDVSEMEEKGNNLALFGGREGGEFAFEVFDAHEEKATG